MPRAQGWGAHYVCLPAQGWAVTAQLIASIPGEHPRLEGGGETARYMKFADLVDVEGPQRISPW